MNTQGLWLITSGAYVSQELAVEFGRLPPSFLPVGVKRLYEYQLERFGVGQRRYLTLPESYVVPEFDAIRLAELGVTLLQVPEDLALGESIVFALNLIGAPDQELRILHGDTLIDLADEGAANAVAIAKGDEEYSWAEVGLEHGHVSALDVVAAGVPAERNASVLCGWFGFASSATLVRTLTVARGDFLKGMLAYGKERPLHPLPLKTWYDFGHLGTFFRSRRLLVSARSFNTLKIDGFVVRKSSADTAKMQAEANWFGSVPPRVRLYSARLIDAGEEDGRCFYETEYAYLPTLAELFVFGTLGQLTWRQILRSCRDFLSVCAISAGPAGGDAVLRQLALGKTTDRLRQFGDATGFNVEAALRYDDVPMPSLIQMAQELGGQINLATNRPQTVMHGDLCFSNILYDSRTQRIHVIDPRGYTESAPTIHGDVRYDLAKLAHSITGRYDQIIAGRYAMPADDGNRFSISFEPAPHHGWLEQALAEMVVDGIAAQGADVRALTILLFLSMLPLHADRPDRQKAFIANALRLYAQNESRIP